ncbi:MAG: thymidylate kinase [Patescibacteria group bacterium]
MRGRLIVIDGVDGTGKATQTKLLVGRLKKEGKKVATFEFPTYETNFFGSFIGECLRGDHGDFVHIDPYIASVLYAADRFESKTKIEDALAAGKIVVLDRYVSANQMHQGGKIKDPKKKKAFLGWLDTMEHTVFGIPRPDVIIYLNLPVKLSLQLLRNKSLKDKKAYIKGKWDVVESDIKYLENSRKSALSIIQELGTWKKVECSEGTKILSREAVHERVFAIVKKILKI